MSLMETALWIQSSRVWIAKAQRINSWQQDLIIGKWNLLSPAFHEYSQQMVIMWVPWEACEAQRECRITKVTPTIRGALHSNAQMIPLAVARLPNKTTVEVDPREKTASSILQIRKSSSPIPTWGVGQTLAKEAIVQLKSKEWRSKW